MKIESQSRKSHDESENKLKRKYGSLSNRVLFTIIKNRHDSLYYKIRVFNLDNIKIFYDEVKMVFSILNERKSINPFFHVKLKRMKKKFLEIESEIKKLDNYENSLNFPKARQG